MPRISKPLAMMAAVASHRSILHMFTFTTSPVERERDRTAREMGQHIDRRSFQSNKMTQNHIPIIEQSLNQCSRFNDPWDNQEIQ